VEKRSMLAEIAGWDVLVRRWLDRREQQDDSIR
jgi:hypothetical protein